ncbi:hypothetical protein [Alteribacter populi]|uniref:hypothetical protein n=1 Tax=Alteribacter populi TaxID=2011011 RepID=UPI000BBA75EE|nr:hypothetical protein [Alteribacter populi]
MFKFKNVSKEEKTEQIVVGVIFFLSIIAGLFIGNNTNWFTSANFSAGYMAGSLVTGLLLFSVYQIINFILGFPKKRIKTN